MQAEAIMQVDISLRC